MKNICRQLLLYLSLFSIILLKTESLPNFKLLPSGQYHHGTTCETFLELYLSVYQLLLQARSWCSQLPSLIRSTLGSWRVFISLHWESYMHSHLLIKCDFTGGCYRFTNLKPFRTNVPFVSAFLLNSANNWN